MRRAFHSFTVFLQLYVDNVLKYKPSKLIWFILQARRTGAVVGTDKKQSSGGNKAHVGMSIFILFTVAISKFSCMFEWLGTDHQRIAKLDRENEVAPPAKIAPTVGKVNQTLHFAPARPNSK